MISKMVAFVLPIVVTLITLNSALSARIAGFSGTPRGSHYFVVKKVMEELSSRGHEVSKNISNLKLNFESWPFTTFRAAITRGA